jgi:hypothetical protein
MISSTSLRVAKGWETGKRRGASIAALADERDATERVFDGPDPLG